MTKLFVGGLTLVVCAAIYVAVELLDLVPGRRNRDRIRAAVAVIVLGVALISPLAFSAAVDWFAHRKTVEIQNQLNDLLPTTTTTG